MKIIVAVSGGMDSLYALTTLKKAGHDVAALHAKLIDSKESPIPALSNFCKKNQIPFYIADLREEFNKDVINPFLKSYSENQTPNPCATCNKRIKLGRLLEIARNYSAEVLATGHYACLENYLDQDNKAHGPCLKNANDHTKNQSYFLALTPIKNLKHCIFPLADKLKKDIHSELINDNTKIPIAKESQEVCFIPNNDYRQFILENHTQKFDFKNSGNVILMDNDPNQQGKILGKHNGLWQYTEGQRKGLKIAYSKPLYVLKKDSEKNVLYVGDKDFINIEEAHATNINFFVPPNLWRNKLFAKTRYKEAKSPIKLFIINKDNGQEIEFTPENKILLQQFGEKLNSAKDQTLNNDFSENKLFHVKIDDLIYQNEEEKLYFQNIEAWNLANIDLKIHFLEPKQVYAKGQVLAIYDDNDFVLAGGILL